METRPMQGVSAVQADANQRFADVATTGFPLVKGNCP
jgi:hypothetical protein